MCMYVCGKKEREREETEKKKTDTHMGPKRERERIIWFGDSLHCLVKAGVVHNLPFSLVSYQMETFYRKGQCQSLGLPQFIPRHSVSRSALADACFFMRWQGDKKVCTP